jgi:cytochrome d ubiquinol oxidase subunit II
MSNETLAYAAAGLALVGLMAYAVLAGADFGGGVWDLFATGPRRRLQRQAIAHAMGPVWEANHVWMIFVIVVLFTCFPRGYAALGVALFLPFHLALIGIMLRGAAFVFRGYDERAEARRRRQAGQKGTLWGAVFGVASIIAPFLLGAAFGAITSGIIRVAGDGTVTYANARPLPWLNVYSVACGLLALWTCAYLAAVYLVVETHGELREDFRARAIVAGTVTAALAAAVLVLAYSEANWFFHRLTGRSVWPILAVGLLLFAASAWAVFTRRYALSRIFAAGEIVMLLLGWGVSYQPYLIYPDVTLVGVMAPPATIRFLLATLPVGAAILVPSLWLLFKVFKAPRRSLYPGQGHS